MSPLRVLLSTPEWPTPEDPQLVPFLPQQVQFLVRAGVEVEVFSFPARRNPLNYARSWFRFQRRVRTGNYDLIHAHFGQGGLVACPKHLPLVVTFHGSDLQGIVGPTGKYLWSGRILTRLSRWVAAHADASVLVSPHLAAYLPSRAYFEVIPCGLDLERFAPIPQKQARQRLGLPLDRRLVLFAGAPGNSVKRYALAQQAMAQLPTGLAADLLPLSGIAHEDVPLLMNACDALLLTSYHEGSPTVVKEALACNLRVVSVDVGDVRQRLAGLSACAVCPSDPYVLGRALGRVLFSSAPFDGRTRVLPLSEVCIAERLIALYRQVIGPPVAVPALNPSLA